MVRSIAAVAAFLGGALFVVIGVVMATRPAGTSVSYRSNDDLAPLAFVAFACVLVALSLRIAVPFPGAVSDRVVLALAAVAAALAFVGLGLGQAFPWTFGSVVAFVLALGASAVRATGPERVLFAAAAVSLSQFNTEDARAWALVPFGAVWIVLAALLFASRTASPRR